MAEKKKTETKKKKAKPRKKKAKKGPDQIYLYSLRGKASDILDLPPVFFEDIRRDLVRRAVLAARANRRQSYGPGKQAGMRHAVSTWGKGRGVARVQRITDGRRGAQSPGVVGGRRAHPPRPWKDWSLKINRKERLKARNSALSAIRDSGMVAERGHRFNKKLTLPVVIEDDVENLEKTGEAVDFLQKLGVYEDVERARDGRKIRAGRGKMRGRRYKSPRSFLFVISDPSEGGKAFKNLPGVDVISPKGLNTELLAPGGDLGRLTLFSAKAFEELRKW
jgi:large subunit ribosomal protein L4e